MVWRKGGRGGVLPCKRCIGRGDLGVSFTFIYPFEVAVKNWRWFGEKQEGEVYRLVNCAKAVRFRGFHYLHPHV